jgi:predicted site-specific integrase-resolvase
MSQQKLTTRNDRVIWRKEMLEILGVCPETLRRWLKTGMFPPPDTDISQKVRGWRLSTLRKHGISLV